MKLGTLVLIMWTEPCPLPYYNRIVVPKLLKTGVKYLRKDVNYDLFQLLKRWTTTQTPKVVHAGWEEVMGSDSVKDDLNK